ncbi:MAG: hypothetical protein H6729_10345 [Deltaproteobacteria bacterium]|nr:hypothetical protein [Deltaproteobacteria bacterium]
MQGKIGHSGLTSTVGGLLAHHGLSPWAPGVMDALKAVNPELEDVDRVHPGQRLNLPEASDIERARAADKTTATPRTEASPDDRAVQSAPAHGSSTVDPKQADAPDQTTGTRSASPPSEVSSLGDSSPSPTPPPPPSATTQRGDTNLAAGQARRRAEEKLKAAATRDRDQAAVASKAPKPAPSATKARRNVAVAGTSPSAAALPSALPSAPTVAAAAAAPPSVPTSTPAPTASADNVLYVGMNPKSAPIETQSLKRSVGPSVAVYELGTRKESSGKTAFGGKDYNLDSPSDRTAFGKALGLRGNDVSELSDLIDAQPPSSRYEVAGLAAAFSESASGEKPIGRLAFSGHSESERFGGRHGEIKLVDVAKIAGLFPEAAAKIDDVNLSGCYTGTKANHALLREAFPKVKTIVGYQSKAPSAAQAPDLMGRWAKATGGPVDTLSRDYAAGTPNAQFLSISTPTSFVPGRRPLRLAEAQRQYEQTKTWVDAYRQGTLPARQERGAEKRLTAHYDRIQQMLGRTDLRDGDRARLTEERDNVLRLRHLSDVSQAFDKAYSQTIRDAYGRQGRSAPVFQNLSRHALIEEVREFQRRAAPQDQPLSDLMSKMLVDLSPEIVSFDWFL